MTDNPDGNHSDLLQQIYARMRDRLRKRVARRLERIEAERLRAANAEPGLTLTRALHDARQSKRDAYVFEGAQGYFVTLKQPRADTPHYRVTPTGEMLRHGATDDYSYNYQRLPGEPV